MSTQYNDSTGQGAANPSKKKQMEQNEQKSLDKFNAITEKSKPENQNQQHNVREEAIHPINQKR